MDQQQATRDSQDDHQVAKAAPQDQAPATAKAINHSPGGKDALGKKENLLSPFYDQMVEVAHELAGQFTPLGLHFRPEILLATAMQEAANKDPLTARSFDNGLGIMQITPYKGKLDANVAKAIGWDNSKDVEYNIAHSSWRQAKPNLQAGAQTMLNKAKAIKRGVPTTWDQMDEPHRWRAVLFAYNAGEGSAVKALKAGGPNATMISSFTDKSGKRVSHDYTAEIKAKMDYVDGHDPFAPGGPGGAAEDHAPAPVEDTAPKKPDAKPAPAGIKASVGRGGANKDHDVRAVQTRLKERGVDPGTVDGDIGPHTVGAIEAFQATLMSHPDGLISPQHTTDKHLFGETGKVQAKPPEKKADAAAPAVTKDKGDAKEEQHGKAPEAAKEGSHPSYDAIAKNFNTAIPGSSLTWHQALYLPSWGRHAKPSDSVGVSIDTVLSNIEKQAAALQKVSDHFGKAIHVHCWWRPKAYNSQIGGASNSAHLRGMATDFHMDGISAEAVRKGIKSTAGLYPGAGENNVSWVHIDLEHHAWFSP